MTEEQFREAAKHAAMRAFDEHNGALDEVKWLRWRVMCLENCVMALARGERQQSSEPGAPPVPASDSDVTET